MSEVRALKVKSGGVLNSEAFSEASREELRVLVAVMERPLFYSTADEIAEAVGVSRARAASALALFTEAGVMIREGDVSYEFEEKKSNTEPRGHELAGVIRDNSLSELFSELCELMGKESLTNGRDDRNIAALVNDIGLSVDFIYTLAAYIKSKGTLTTAKLLSKAKMLDGLGINTSDKLDEYIKNEENNGSLEWEFKKTFRRYAKPPQPAELEIYRKWTETFGFSSDIVKLAIEINVMSKADYTYSYMDTLLTRWHECGCKTYEECKRQSEIDRARISDEMKRENAPKKDTSKTKAPTPKYGDFDPDEAFARALERSYAKYASDAKED